uniref:Uncharacterized protein n=1 Tax=Phaeomonas parva TaxID=124430 RepID=A0A6U4GK07_9STRA|mmetsp:Transcript_27244/g.85785  ORF Transcript_27244/g.85785 Transcript_27244/m.85785 type:complete len:180 (+) Transcript_27244:298-837(+)
MVLVHIKTGGEAGDEFIVESSVENTNDELIAQIVHVWNLRLRLGQLCGAMMDLAAHGPMKPNDQQGLDEIQEKYSGASIDRGEFYAPDPNGMRTGNGVGPQLTQTFEAVVADARTALDPALARRRQACSAEDLEEKLANMRGAVVMAFPMGLPEFDTVTLTLTLTLTLILILTPTLSQP